MFWDIVSESPEPQLRTDDRISRIHGATSFPNLHHIRECLHKRIPSASNCLLHIKLYGCGAFMHPNYGIRLLNDVRPKSFTGVVWSTIQLWLSSQKISYQDRQWEIKAFPHPLSVQPPIIRRRRLSLIPNFFPLYYASEGYLMATSSDQAV